MNPSGTPSSSHHNSSAFRSWRDLQSGPNINPILDGSTRSDHSEHEEEDDEERLPPPPITMGIPLPPLYYKGRDDNDVDEGSKGTIDAFTYTYKTPEKQRGMSPAAATPAVTNAAITSGIGGPSTSAFVPIERAHVSRGGFGTPPLTPLVSKNLKYYTISSPSPSMVSLAPTEDCTTQGSLTPRTTTPGLSPTTTTSGSGGSSYLQAVNSTSPIQSPLSFASPLPRTPSPSPYSRPTSLLLNSHQNSHQNNNNTKISPKKFRRDSPTTIIPYSPGNSSLGSNQSTEEQQQCRSTPRKQRLKTELCMHWTNGRECPFGDTCTYAHGEHELQITKLLDFQRAGLIEDAQTYRTKPCWTWVATGSCPFGKRCACLHDPRIGGGPNAFISWLPHTETQGNSMTTDVNVDGLHQKRLGTILYDNPFGEHHSLEMDGFSHLYELVCNTSVTMVKRRRSSHHSNSTNNGGISEAHKVAMALKMRERHTWTYKYRPQHVIYGEPCMVLEKRAFQLDKSGQVQSIPIGHFNPKNKQHAMVREIAFGPDNDNSVRGVALWFNIPDLEVTACTPYQARRFRWKKKPKSDSPVESRHPPRTSVSRTTTTTPRSNVSILDTRDCFVMVRPSDPDAFELATRMLHHRHATLLTERFVTTLSERAIALEELAKEEETLKEMYRTQKLSWIRWAWPMHEGRRGVIDRNTPIPPVDGIYQPRLSPEGLEGNGTNPTKTEEPDDDDPQSVLGVSNLRIWDSFLYTCFHEDPQHHVPPKGRNIHHRRLEPFLKLEQGKDINSDRRLPHITKSYHHTTNAMTGGGKKLAPLSRQSEICWRALLERDERHPAKNEWDMVLDHFQNSRSKNILEIIQK